MNQLDMTKSMQVYNHIMKVTGVTLNESQKILALGLEKNQICGAVPGSGKTNALKYRVANEELIHRIPASRIYVMTFTNKATDEFRHRHADLMKRLGLHSRVNISTIHAFCKHFVQLFHTRIGIPSITMMQEKDTKEFLANIVKVVLQLKDDQLQVKRLNDIHSAISFLDNRLYFTEEEVCQTQQFIDLKMEFSKLQMIREIFSDSQRKNGMLGFDEVMLVIYDLLRTNENIRREIQNMISSLFVDEFQDTNALQLEIIKMILTPETRFCCVGDNDQSIFRWRGAVDTFNRIMNHLGNGNYKLVEMDINYRCPDYVITCANALIRNTENRIPIKAVGTGKKGKLTIIGVTSNKQASLEIAKLIIEDYRLHGNDNYRLMQKLVLYRNHSQGMFLVYELAQNKIPVNTAGVLVPHRDAIVKDILAMCSVLQNPRNSEMVSRMMYKFNSFINRPKSLTECPFYTSDEKTHYAQVQTKFSNNKNYLDEINLLQRAEKIIKEGKPVIEAFNVLIPLYMKAYYMKYNRHIAQGKTEEDVFAIQNFLLTGLDPSYALDQFEYVCRQVDAFINESNKDNVGVKILSIHSAKSLEAKEVYLLDMNGSVQPNMKLIKELQERKAWGALEEHIHEERSLAYVAMTRTTSDLIVTYNINNPSPFNMESGLNVDKRAYVNVLPLSKLGVPKYVEMERAKQQGQSAQQTGNMSQHQRSLIEQMQNKNVEKEQKALSTIEYVKSTVNGKVNEGQERPQNSNTPLYDPFAGL